LNLKLELAAGGQSCKNKIQEKKEKRICIDLKFKQKEKVLS
jgi:hypothetical protein